MELMLMDCRLPCLLSQRALGTVAFPGQLKGILISSTGLGCAWSSSHGVLKHPVSQQQLDNEELSGCFL